MYGFHVSGTIISKPCNGRLKLPSAQPFGRSYACCHQQVNRSWLRIQIDYFKDPMQSVVRSDSFDHPLCCNQGWAVSIYHLCIRRRLKSAIRRRSLFADADGRVRSLVFSHFPQPDFSSYWELVLELSEERRRARTEKMAAYSRVRETQEFVTRTRRGGAQSKPKATFPPCLVILGFKRIPANQAEIKTAYRRLALLLHPDQAGGNATEFKRIDQAFQEAIQWAERTLE